MWARNRELLKAGEEEVVNRGGKYEYEIVEFIPDDSKSKKIVKWVDPPSHRTQPRRKEDED